MACNDAMFARADWDPSDMKASRRFERDHQRSLYPVDWRGPSGGSDSVTLTRKQQHLAEQIVLRVAVSQVLAKALGECHTDIFAALRAPITHSQDVLIHAVMFHEPIALTGVT